MILQGFRTSEEVQRFGDMMDEMCYIVATKHGGSLKVLASPSKAVSSFPYCQHVDTQSHAHRARSIVINGHPWVMGVAHQSRMVCQ